MRAILLAAGYGTRLRPLTNKIPKCYLPINGKPLIEYWLEQLTDAGIERFLVNVHHHDEYVYDYFKTSSYSSRVDLVYEKELLMTGGTVLQNAEYFNNEAFMLVHADNLSICNFREFIDKHKTKGSDTEITMMTFKTDTPESCGIVELDSNGIVQKYVEKSKNPSSNLANSAVYIMEPSVINMMSAFKKKKIDISQDVIPNYMGKIGTYHNDLYHRDIGTISSYSKSQVEIYLMKYKYIM